MADPKPAPPGTPLPGGWLLLKETDDFIANLGRSAVNYYNQQNGTNLSFERVTNAEMNKMSGHNYRLTALVQDQKDNMEYYYEALAFQGGNELPQIISVNPLK